MKSKASKSPTDVVEREKLNIERARVNVEVARCVSDKLRANTERIEQLMDIVKYFNSQQEEERTSSRGTYEKFSTVRFARNLNGHEEDIYNAALIQLKNLIGFQDCTLRTEERKEAR